MPNPNITPRPENLTRAGMGQPKKHRKRVQITLPPDLLGHLDAITNQQGWDRSYTIEQLCKSSLGLNSDYNQNDFALIKKGCAIE